MKKNVNYKFFEIFWGARVTVKNCKGKIATGKKWNEKVEKECKDDIKKKSYRVYFLWKVNLILCLLLTNVNLLLLLFNF